MKFLLVAMPHSKFWNAQWKGVGKIYSELASEDFMDNQMVIQIASCHTG